MTALTFFLSAAAVGVLLLASRSQALTCDELDLLCPGMHPTEFTFTLNRANIPSKDGSAYVWAASGTPRTDLTSNITCEEKSNHLLIHSTGIPSANIGRFPFTQDTDGNGHGDNPNTMSAQVFQWKIPKTPIIKASIPPTATGSNNQLPMGPIGFTRSGVPFYNPYNSQQLDAVDPTSNGYEVMDLCFGHPDMQKRYHHHYIKSKSGCLFQDTPGQHSPKLGYAFDGIPIYGPLSWNGTKPTDLDNCNGRNDPTLGYIYHTTDTAAPYIIGCYRYQVIRQRFGGAFRGDIGAIDDNPGKVGTKCSATIGSGPQSPAGSSTATTATSQAGVTTSVSTTATTAASLSATGTTGAGSPVGTQGNAQGTNSGVFRPTIASVTSFLAIVLCILLF